MRVLVYSHDFAPGSGGLTTFSNGLAAGLVALGVKVRLATATEGSPMVIRPWPVHSAVTARELIRLCRWADVVHMNGFRAAVLGAAWLTRRPVIWTHHEYSFCPTGLGWWQGRDRSFALPQCWGCLRDRGFDRRSAVRRIAATLLRRISGPLVAEHTVTTQYMKFRLKLAGATVVPLGTTLAFNHRSEAAATDVFTVVCAARLIREKGVDIAICAIAQARQHGLNVRLEVVGDGPERPALEDLARRELPEFAVSFVGRLDRGDVLARICLADAVLVPSVWSEPAGFVVLEAMALGVPVIAADCGGIPEVARGAALLVKPSDVAAFAKAIVVLATDPLLALALVDRGKSTADAQPSESMVAQYKVIYGRALEPR